MKRISLRTQFGWWLRQTFMAASRCWFRGGHAYERFYGDRYPPRKGQLNAYQCARCYLTFHVYPEEK